MSLNFKKPQLVNEDKIISEYLKKKKIDHLINLEHSFNLKKENVLKITNYIDKSYKKINKFKILVISNLSYQIFQKTFLEKLLIKKIKGEIEYVDYNSFLVKKNFDKYNFVFLFPDSSDLQDISHGAEDLYFNKIYFNESCQFYNLLINKLSKYNAKIFLGNLINFDKLDFGTYTKKIKNLRIEMIIKLNKFLLNKINENNFYLLDLETLTYKYGLNIYRDNSKFLFGRVPFTLDYSDYLFSIIANLISIASGKIKKLLVLDLDNTLWGGILGDDGPKGIIIGNDSPLGKAFLDFQRSILNLKKRGVLLAICSKNELENVKNVFKKNENLILKFNDFVSIKANWNNKAQNIKQISQDLNIGTDSFVFFDDNPVERNLIRHHLPEVLVPELDEDPSNYANILLNNYYFDIVAYSKEDLNRSKTYLKNLNRELLKDNFNNIDDYLKSLKMICEVSKFKNEDFDRIVQLFQRSNQFNFTTIRYSLNDIQKITKNKNKMTLQFSFKDKFSNYGVISLMVCNIIKNTLLIENWVMSCRVLNRTLENFVINKLVKFCLKNKIKVIKSQYIKTEKNALVKNLFNELDFDVKKQNNKFKEYIFSIDKFKIKKTFIKEKN